MWVEKDYIFGGKIYSGLLNRQIFSGPEYPLGWKYVEARRIFEVTIICACPVLTIHWHLFIYTVEERLWRRRTLGLKRVLHEHTLLYAFHCDYSRRTKYTIVINLACLETCINYLHWIKFIMWFIKDILKITESFRQHTLLWSRLPRAWNCLTLQN